jgi:hypothetical protein
VFIDFLVLRKAPPRILLLLFWWGYIIYAAVWSISSSQDYFKNCSFSDWRLYQGVGLSVVYGMIMVMFMWLFLNLVDRIVYGSNSSTSS